jgi:hypothetical protein
MLASERGTPQVRKQARKHRRYHIRCSNHDSTCGFGRPFAKTGSGQAQASACGQTGRAFSVFVFPQVAMISSTFFIEGLQIGQLDNPQQKLPGVIAMLRELHDVCGT